MDGTSGLTLLSHKILDDGINGPFPEAGNNAIEMRKDLPRAFLFLA